MANVNRERQSSFAAGELAPGMYGRTDFTKYGSGCRTAHNFFVTPWGTLANRPGTQLIHALSKDATAVNNTARLVPFIFSDTESVLLVFIPQKVFFFRYDSTAGTVVPVTFTSTPGLWPTWSDADLEQRTTPYTYDELMELRFSQVGDVVTIVHENHAPRELTRTSSDSSTWTFEEVSLGLSDMVIYGVTPGIRVEFDAELGDPSSGIEGDLLEAKEWKWVISRIYERSDGTTYETAPYEITIGAQLAVDKYDRTQRWMEYDGDYDINPSWYRYAWIDDDDDNVYRCLQTNGFGTVPGIHEPVKDTTTDYWEPVAWTNIRIGPGGAIGIDPRWLVAIPSKIEVSASRPVTIDWTELPRDEGAPPATVDTLIETRVYRGQEGLYGFVGRVGSDGVDFIDRGGDPDYSVSPPEGENPFESANPSVVTMYESRRWLASTTDEPTKTWGSAIEQYRNFDQKKLPLDSDSVSFELASNYWENIRAIEPGRGLLIFTDSAEWVVGGSGENAVITPASIAARRISQYGSGKLEPLPANSMILFMQRKGTVPRAMGLSPQGSHQAFDISALSRHLFNGYEVLDWAFAEDPWSMVWAVRDDGVLLSCAIIPEQELVAWTRHTITDGTVTSVASIPEGREDAVYLSVVRNGQVHIERMASRNVTDIREAVFLDGARRFDGRNTGTNTATVTEYTDSITAFADAGGGQVTVTSNGHGIGDGATVYITGTTSYDGTYVTSNTAANTFEITATWVADDATGDWSRGTDYFDTAGLAIQDTDAPDGSDWTGNKVRVHVGDDSILVDVTAKNGANDYDCRLLENLPSTVDGVASTTWGRAVNSIAGLSHLTGNDIYVLADGHVSGPYTGDSVDFTNGDVANSAEVVSAGALFNSDFESLNSLPEKGRQRTARAATLEIDGVFGGAAGQSLDSLETIRARKVDDAFGPVALGYDEHTVPLKSKWAESGRVAYRHNQPLPVTLLGVTREMVYGG